MEITKELKNVVEKGKDLKGQETSFYDYISANYYKLSKEQLKEIIINMDYAIYCRNEEMTKEIEKETVAYLKERGF